MRARSRGSVAAVLLQAACAVVAGVVLLRGNHVDFDVYVAAGRHFLDGADPYAAAGELPFTYPPFALLLAVGFAAVPWLSLTVLAALTVIAAWASTRAVVGQFDTPALGGALLCGAAVVSEPVLRGLHLGQVNGLVLGLVVADFCLVPRRWRGVLTGIAAGIKLTPLVFALVLLVRADWRPLARLAGTFVATVAVGGLIVPDGFTVWTRLLTPSRVGNPAFVDNQSLRGLLDRALGAPTPTWLWLLCVVAVLGTGVVLLWRTRRDHVIAGVLVCSLVGVLASPISWSHHWLLLVPLIAWVALATSAPRVGGSITHLTAVTVAGAVAVLAPHWWLPRSEWERAPYGLGGQLLASSMTLLGVGLLLVLLLLTRRMSPETPALTGTMP